MTPTRWTMWAAGVGLVATVAVVLANGVDSGGSTTPGALVLLSALAGVLPGHGVGVVPGAGDAVARLGARCHLVAALALPASGRFRRFRRRWSPTWSWVLIGLVVMTVGSLRDVRELGGHDRPRRWRG